MDRLNRVGNLQTVREIWYTDEGVRYRLNQNYGKTLRRSVDFSGVQYWYPFEMQATSPCWCDLAPLPSTTARPSKSLLTKCLL